MSVDTFWTTVDACLDEIESALTVDEVITTLNRHFADDLAQLGCGDAFFPGSGGDRQLRDALRTAGWTVVWSEAPYFYVARDVDGELMTYIEGDVYRGDQR